LRPSTPKPIRLLLIADEPIMRAGLRLLLKDQRKSLTVNEAASYTEAFTIASQEPPDIILLDLKPGDDKNLNALPELLTGTNHAAVIVLTGMDDPQTHQRAIALGAMGLVQKKQKPAALFEAIDHVHSGQVWVGHSVLAGIFKTQAQTLEKHVDKADSEAARLASLTERERQIISLISDGLNTEQMATHLFIAESTVRNHVASIFKKLNVPDRLRLAVYAYRHGLHKTPSQRR
jgi:two-component system nitrate/nitrite response regulator NarL